MKFRFRDAKTGDLFNVRDSFAYDYVAVNEEGKVIIFINYDGASFDNDLICERSSELFDPTGKEIFENDIIYLAGYGNFHVKFPFIELYDGMAEKDIGNILGDAFNNKELLEGK